MSKFDTITAPPLNTAIQRGGGFTVSTSVLPPGGSLPLADLVALLESHAATLPTPVDGGTLFSLPRGLPDRISAPRAIIVPGRYQPRSTFDQAALDELAESLREHGVLTALKVFANEHGQLELIAGERRWRAADQAELSMLPVELCAYTLVQIAEISAIDNLQRANLTALEEGRFFERIIGELGISEAALSRRLSRNRASIQQRRAIASAAPVIQEALEAGTLTFSQARGITSAAPGLPKVQAAALKKLADKLVYGRVDESDARRITEQLLQSQYVTEIKKLGWSLEPWGDTPLIWGGDSAPTKWSLDDLRDAVQAQRRPSGTPPAAYTLTEDEAAALKRLGWSQQDDGAKYAPWFVLNPGGDTRYLHPAAVSMTIADGAAAWQSLLDRAAATGWQIDASSGYWCSLISPAGRREMCKRVELSATLALIEAGQIASTPPVSQQRQQIPHTPHPRQCRRCETIITDGTAAWMDGGYLCATCADAYTAAHQVAQASAQQHVAALCGVLLDQADPALLRLLAHSMEASGVDSDERDPSTLRDGILQALTSTQLWLNERGDA